MLEVNLAAMRQLITELDYQPLFVTVSGAHLYGFPSADSDVDLRGCHRLPLREIVGLKLPKQTVEHKTFHGGTEVELVSHEIAKYFRLLVKNNGCILEQILSPIVVMGRDFLDQLRPLSLRCITRNHYHHYRGFYAMQRKLLEKENPKRIKPLLYAYRVLMTGIHLMHTGEIEANLPRLNEQFHLSFLADLIKRKTSGENIALDERDWVFHTAQLASLETALDLAFEESNLPLESDRDGINEFLVFLRLRNS